MDRLYVHDIIANPQRSLSQNRFRWIPRMNVRAILRNGESSSHVTGNHVSLSYLHIYSKCMVVEVKTASKTACLRAIGQSRGSWASGDAQS